MSLRHSTFLECCRLGHSLIFCKRCDTFPLNLPKTLLKKRAFAFPKTSIQNFYTDYIKMSLTGHRVMKSHS